VSHFASFMMAHLCPLGPQDRMNCTEIECSNQTWVRLRASPRSLPESAHMSSSHNWFEVFHLGFACMQLLYRMVRFTLGEAVGALEPLVLFMRACIRCGMSVAC
jgi:hypothetical protein